MKSKTVKHIAWDIRLGMESRGRKHKGSAPWQAYVADELEPLVALLFSDAAGTDEWRAARAKVITAMIEAPTTQALRGRR